MFKYQSKKEQKKNKKDFSVDSTNNILNLGLFIIILKENKK